VGSGFERLEQKRENLKIRQFMQHPYQTALQDSRRKLDSEEMKKIGFLITEMEGAR